MLLWTHPRPLGQRDLSLRACGCRSASGDAQDDQLRLLRPHGHDRLIIDRHARHQFPAIAAASRDRDLRDRVHAACRCWPATRSARMKAVALERDKIRAARARAPARGEGPGHFAAAGARAVHARIVERFNLRKALADGEAERKLAGRLSAARRRYDAFLFFRLVVPIVGVRWRRRSMSSGSTTRPAGDRQDRDLRSAPPMRASTRRSLRQEPLIAKRQQSIRRAFPDALDLLLICVESGMSIEAAFRKVAEEIGAQSVPLAEELTLTTAELSYLQDRRQAYENLAKRTGLDGVKSVCMALIQAERYGTPLGQALRVLAQENRDMRMNEAEKKAAALPPKLTVPMILFFLPVLFAVILGPASPPPRALPLVFATDRFRLGNGPDGVADRAGQQARHIDIIAFMRNRVGGNDTGRRQPQAILDRRGRKIRRARRCKRPASCACARDDAAFRSWFVQSIRCRPQERAYGRCQRSMSGTDTSTSRSACRTLFRMTCGAPASRATIATHCSLSASGPIRSGRSTCSRIQAAIRGAACSATARVSYRFPTRIFGGAMRVDRHQPVECRGQQPRESAPR
jgi:tight adherence protein C